MTPPSHDRLLLACGRLACDDRALAGFQSVIAPVTDWDALLGQAAVEGLTGLLHEQITAAGLASTIPPAAGQRLRQSHLQNSLDYEQKAAAVDRLAEAFDADGLRVLLLQGMGVIDLVYPSAGARPLSDVDLLIRRRDLEQAQLLLARLGAAAISRYPPVYLLDGVRLDLHPELAYLSRVEPASGPLRVDDAPLWAEAAPWRAGCDAIRRLSLPDQLLVSAGHLQKHSFNRLIWFVDLGRLLTRYVDEWRDWKALVERANLLRLDRPLYFALLYLKEVFHLPCLQHRDVVPPTFTFLERALSTLLARGRRIDGMGDLLYLSAIDRPAARLRFLVEIALPRPAVMRESLATPSAWGLGAAYARRLGRLAHSAFRLAMIWLGHLSRRGGRRTG
jgi:hypothetical protein